jgi:hypothetical protein
MPRRVGSYIRIIVSLYMWFCDHSEWWGVWLLWRWCGVTRVTRVTVGGRCCSTLGGGFGVVGGRVDIHIRVCISPEGLGMCVAPPTVRSLEQVSVASFF